MNLSGYKWNKCDFRACRLPSGGLLAAIQSLLLTAATRSCAGRGAGPSHPELHLWPWALVILNVGITSSSPVWFLGLASWTISSSSLDEQSKATPGPALGQVSASAGDFLHFEELYPIMWISLSLLSLYVSLDPNILPKYNKILSMPFAYNDLDKNLRDIYNIVVSEDYWVW